MRKSYKLLSLIACSLLSVTAADAQVVSGNGFLKADYIEAGIRPNGAFGTTVKAPSNYFYHNNTDFGGRLGFISDVGKDGWTVGSPAYIGDYFLPGTPYEGFSVQANGGTYRNDGSNSNGVPGGVTGFSTTDVSQTVQWIGNVAGIRVRQEATVEKTQGFILVNVTLVNTSAATITDIYYTREVDPDNEVTQGGGYDTRNVIEQQNPNSISTALISARGLTHNSYLGLGSRDCRAKVAVPTSWPYADGKALWAGTGTRLITPGSSQGDFAMSVAFNIGSLAAGDSTSLSFAYVLNAADLPEAMDRTDPLFNVKTNTYGSGSSIDVCAGQEQTIEIVNGNGFNWTWSPATGLSSTTGRAVKATLTGRATYIADGVNTCGTTRRITITLDPTIIAAPGAAEVITGSEKIIRGMNATYSVPVIDGATSYKWTLPAGATYVAGYNTNTITVNFGPYATSGEISVAGANGCGEGAVAKMTATINTLAAPTPKSSNPTSNKRPVFTGTAIPNGTVTLYRGTTVIGTGAADADGKYEITPTANFTVGTHTITITATEGGVTSSASNALMLAINNGPATPPAPQLSTGTSPMNVSKPALKGTAAANATVTIYINGENKGTTPSDASGNWTYTPTTDLTDGEYDITITATDDNDVTSNASPALKIEIDTQAPGKVTIGRPTGTSPINDNTPAISGEGEPNSIVTIYVDGNEVGTAPVDADGKWSYTLPTVLTDGDHTVTAAAKDAAGNVGESSEELKVTIDTTVPGKTEITIPVTDSLLNTGKPVISGTGEANSKIYIYVNGNIADSVTADADGKWTFTPAEAFDDGEYTLTTTATDAAGNTGEASEPVKIKIDTKAPDKPTTTLASGNNPLNVNLPKLSGDAEPNSIVDIYVGGVIVTTVTADVSGKWNYEFTSPLGDGEHKISTTATDEAGNTSNISDVLTLVIDTEKPAAPLLPVLEDGNEGHTGKDQPTINGKAEPGAVVIIYVDGEVTDSTTADVNGDWKYTVRPALTDGPHKITTTAKDKAGNTSEASEGLDIIVDTIEPGQPAIGSPANNTPVKTAQPTITGTGEANSKIHIYINGEVVDSLMADANGKWSYTPAKPLTDGDHTLTTTATDAAGNKSAASTAVKITVDTKQPEQPTTTLASGKNPLNSKLPSLSGKAEPNSKVDIYIDGKKVTTVTVDANGKWEYVFTSPLAEGEHQISTTATDAAGNTSASSDVLKLVIDTEVPVTPAAPAQQDANNGHTNKKQPVFNGKSEPGAIITIYINDVVVGTAPADENGNWQYTIPTELLDGEYKLSTTATDAAGNTSQASAPVEFTVDTVVPEMPSTPVLHNGQPHTNNNKPSLNGTGEPNTIITIYHGEQVLGTATVAADGTWTYDVVAPLPDGDNTFAVTVTDAAGNTSARSGSFSLLVDTESPVPTISAGVTSVTGAFEITIKFNESVTGFAASSLTLTNASVTAFTAISANEYKATIMPVSERAVAINIAANTVMDAVGNGNINSNAFTVDALFNATVESVYPNPTSGNINIRFNGVVPATGKVMLVNMLGQVVLRQDLGFQGTTMTLNTSGLAQGIYVLMVNTKTYTYKTRISIVR
ncbi:Ig-like domain-containing protein [Chitinophaga horti]|uniref:Ig-like domain-containing protein n=1 Tax=Chitinophaga horti TaxID=2920382 RepID=A0ABY6IXL6_9BACT|nr:Ig-like domain-containing protein [Chitinophaga horti]UYQ92130.1 Ig-like domain-containing protein [Chitinophaga horti]